MPGKRSSSSQDNRDSNSCSMLDAREREYLVPMPPAVLEMVATTYVRDIDVSGRFYELLGFHEQSSGKAANSAWSALHGGSYTVLLASTTPPLELAALPLLFYFYFDDIDAAIDVIRAGGIDVLHLGYPPHALGGEAKVLDPDGNTILLGQRERSASQPPLAEEQAPPQFSLLKETAAVVAARGRARTVCQVRDMDRSPRSDARSGMVLMVKPSGRSEGSSSSSQAIGAETGAPGAARGL